MTLTPLTTRNTRPTDRYQIHHEGDWTRAVYDTTYQSYVLRAAPPILARAFAFAANALTDGYKLVAVTSRFHVLGQSSGTPPNQRPLFFSMEDDTDGRPAPSPSQSQPTT